MTSGTVADDLAQEPPTPDDYTDYAHGCAHNEWSKGMDSTTSRDRPILRATAALAAACLATLLPAGSAAASPLVPHGSVGAITIVLTHRPSAESDSSRATFSWRTTGIVGETRCKLDRAAYGYCPGNPARLSGLSDGRHTFTVRVRNGYRVSASATYSWLVDTAAPSDPTVSGGSASWRNVGSGQIHASGSTDSLSGLGGYEWRISTDGGGWSNPASGASATVHAEGTTYVQFRGVDQAGNRSAWQPIVSGVDNMLRLDRTPPTTPVVVGGTLAWQGVASMTVTGSGATDALSGVDHYEYRISTDGGATYGSQATGHIVTFTTSGSYVVQFRAVDGVGLAGAWAPASPGAANSACIS